VHLLRRNASQQGKIADDHQPLYVVGVGMF